jgi:hypothetical protein
VRSDPTVAARLEAMTALDAEHVETLAELVRPARAFPERIVVGVRSRIDALETLGVLVDLMGVGWQTGQALLSDNAIDSDPTDRAHRTDED